MIVSALAAEELLRTFRRRETFWTAAGLAALLAVPPVGALVPFVKESFSWELFSPMISLETVRRVEFHLEAVILCALSFYLGLRAVRSELESGSWVLLAGTPVRVWRILLGKALGLLAATAVFHVVLSVPSLMLGPTSNESFRTGLLRGLLQLLFAFGFVPEGMLYGWMGRKSPMLTYALYPLTLARLSGLALVLFGAAQLAGNVGPRELFESYFASQTWNPPEVSFSERFAHPSVPWSIVLSWQAATGLAYGWVLARLAR